MIKLIGSFSAQVRILPDELPDRCKLMTSFSAGVKLLQSTAKRLVIAHCFSVMLNEDVLDKTVKFIRKK